MSYWMLTAFLDNEKYDLVKIQMQIKESQILIEAFDSLVVSSLSSH